MTILVFATNSLSAATSTRSKEYKLEFELKDIVIAEIINQSISNHYGHIWISIDRVPY